MVGNLNSVTVGKFETEGITRLIFESVKSFDRGIINPVLALRTGTDRSTG